MMKFLVYGLSFAVVVGAILFVLVSAWIGITVERTCSNAEEDYGEECVFALTTLLDDENRTFRERNDAVWTLGQLGDVRALPALERYYTGEIPEREPLGEMLSQYELQKAIRLLQGERNITVLFRGLWSLGRG